MTPELAEALVGLLERVPKDRLNEFIKALDYFNTTCSEQSRAACARNGCMNSPDPELEERVQAALRKKQVLLEKSAEMYLQGKQPVCKCCGR